MARITMRKTQETKLSEIFTLYLASAAARGVKDKTLRTYEQHFNAISKRLDVDSNISQITSKDLDKIIVTLLDWDRMLRQIRNSNRNPVHTGAYTAPLVLTIKIAIFIKNIVVPINSFTKLLNQFSSNQKSCASYVY